VSPATPRPAASPIHRRVALVLQAILAVEVVVALWNGAWFTAAITTAIIGVTLLPLVVSRALHVYVPPQFQMLAIAFVFATLFLGEVRGYYTRYWWWDIVLHTSSGVLLGIIGFLLVHVLNEIEDIGLDLKPGFVALFAFVFALAIGALWEVFEFAMDTLVGTTMQKPMLGDDSGLTDTMWDLIVDGAGALVISLLGYRYLSRRKGESFLEAWIDAFVRANPRLFRTRGD
jgi:uncharacterized membrane protein YjdF